MSERDRTPQLFGVLAAVIAVVLAVGLVVVVVDDEAGVPESGARATVDGIVLVVHRDGSSTQLESGDVVAGGDEVQVQSGTVVLELASGALVEGREGRDEVDDRFEVEGTRVRVGTTPELLAGDLLVRGGVPVTVGAGGNDVSFAPDGDDSAVKIRRGLSVTVGSYWGRADLDSAGQQRRIPAYRQLTVASIGRPPASPDPLRLDATDTWDLRYLGIAFELTRRLDSLSGTYTANLGPNGATAEALETILPDLGREPDFGPTLLLDDRNAARPGGETLVGVSIALLGRGGEFADRYGEVTDFHDDGAEWGLVALDQAVDDGDLIDIVEAAYGRAIRPPVEVAVGTGRAATAPSSLPTGTTGADGAPTSSDGDQTETTTTPTTSPPTTVTPPTLPPIITLPTLPPLPNPTPPSEGDVLPDTGVPILDTLVEPLDDLLAGILGG